MRKHFVTRYKEKIASLEYEISFLSEKILQLEPSADKMFQKFKNEKRQRIIIETARRKAESENIGLKHKIAELERKQLNQEKLLEELKKANTEIKALQKKLNSRSGAEAPYGLSTPSSKLPNKENSSAENQAKRGGARKGHKGHGRKRFSPEEADSEIYIENLLPPCPCGCGTWKVAKPEPEPHSVIRFIPSKIKRQIFYKYLNICSGCGKTATAKTPGVLPRSLYSNSMIAHVLTEFFLWGNTAGSIEKRTGINIGTFFDIAHRTGASLKPIFDNILKELRCSLFLHADETPWMKDGVNSYAWLFANDDFRVFIYRHSRSSTVPLAILGEKKLPLVLITDRYNGYNPLNTERQFCYVHLLRNIRKLEKEFPDDKEIKCFA